MAAEQYISLSPGTVTATLSGNIGSGALSLTVSDATKFPTTGGFRIAVGPGANGPAELMWVTSVSGAVFTIGAPPEGGTGRGLEGSTITAHGALEPVRQVLTALGGKGLYQAATKRIPVDLNGLSTAAVDNTTALQNLYNAMPANSVLEFGPGTYSFTGTLLFNRGDTPLLMVGVGQGGTVLSNPNLVGTFITITNYSYPKINGIYFRADLGTAVFQTGVGDGFGGTGTINSAQYYDCDFKGHKGFYSSPNGGFLSRFDACRFHGNYAAGDIGLLVNQATANSVINCDFTGLSEGIRACGTGCNIVNCRFEVNLIGMNLGTAPDGTGFTLGRSVVHGISGESNTTYVKIANCRGVAFSGMQCIVGTGACSGGTNGTYGFDIQGATYCSFNGIDLNGTIDKSCMHIAGADHCTFKSVAASASAIGAAWDVAQGLDTLDIDPVTCNYLPRPNSAQPARRGGGMGWLGKENNLTDTVEGKNLSAVGVKIGSGVHTLAIAFTGDHTGANADINALTATNGGTLAAATYFVRATIVTIRGECASAAEHSVVVGGGNNAFTVSFFGQANQDGYKRRIYVGTATGVYNGYFEAPLNSDAVFTVLNTTYDGVGRTPPTGGVDDTSMIEPDANYGVLLGFSFNAGNWWITNKATTGFTANWVTNTPDANQTLDWLIVR